MLRQLRIKSSLLAFVIAITITTTANAFIIPTGQFCPYRSEAWVEYKSHLEDVTKAHQKLLTTIVSNDPIGDIEDFLYEWERLTWYKETSTDYQLHEMESELDLLTQTTTQSSSRSRFHCQMDTIQNELIPFCRNLVQQLKQQQQQRQNEPEEECSVVSDDEGSYNLVDCSLLELQQLCMDTSLDEVSIENKISAEPFSFAAFRKQPYQVQMEILHLLDDHKALIQGREGSAFKTMKKFQQNQFLDKLRDIEERWEIAFIRFQLYQAENNHDTTYGSEVEAEVAAAPQAINPQYVKECQEWLTELNMSENQYKQLHATYLQLPQQSSTTTSVGCFQQQVPSSSSEQRQQKQEAFSEYYNSENAFQ